jgi:hypothetical protein
MSNLIVGWPVYSDAGVTYTPTLSGGSWLAALPLTNLQDRRLHKVARSSDDAEVSTTFDIDLKVARPVFVLAVPKHNLSTSGTVRVLGASSNSFASAYIVYDTTAVTAIVTGVTAEMIDGINVGWTHVISAGTTARYWRFSFADTANPDTYVELGRVIVAGGWQPTLNMRYGAKLGLEDDSGRALTDGGAAVYTERQRRRTFTCAIPEIPEAEALASGFDLQRLAGTVGQMMVVYDPSDTTHMHRRAFLATLRELGALESVPVSRYGVPLSFVEEL